MTPGLTGDLPAIHAMHQATAASACVSLTCHLPLTLKTELSPAATDRTAPSLSRHGMDIEMRH
jgi:hypothetical protein